MNCALLEDKVDFEEESNDRDPTVGPSVQGMTKRTITKPGKWKNLVTTDKRHKHSRRLMSLLGIWL